MNRRLPTARGCLDAGILFSTTYPHSDAGDRRGLPKTGRFDSSEKTTNSEHRACEGCTGPHEPTNSAPDSAPNCVTIAQSIFGTLTFTPMVRQDRAMDVLARLFRWLPGSTNRAHAKRSVFTPGAMPSITYVDRAHLGLEDELRSALVERHGFTVVSGPSKCGKSVLCKTVLQGKNLIEVAGGQIETAGDFWQHLAHHLNIGGSYTNSRVQQSSIQGTGGLTIGKPLVGSISLTSQANIGRQETEAATFNTVLSIECVKKLAKKKMGILVEDFHYINSDTQRSIVRSLKTAVFEGLTVILLAVPHRSYDPADVEGEVEGRLYNVNIPNWDEDDLLQIVDKGFAALQMDVPRPVRRKIAEDAFGSPLLVQDICRKLCDLAGQQVWKIESISNTELKKVYDKVINASGLSRYERHHNNLGQAGFPDIVDLRSGGQDKLTSVLLAAVARLGPKPTTSYSEIRESFEALARSQAPTLQQTGQLFEALSRALSKSHAPPLEWLEAREELALLDPFLMFYMRWVLRDKRKLVLATSAVDAAFKIQPRSLQGREGYSE